FGPQQIFHGEAVVVARLQREPSGVQTVQLKVDYQGCAEIGVCYPPLNQTVTVSLPAVTSPPNSLSMNGEGGTKAGVGSEPAGGEAEQDRLARMLGEQRFLAIPAFFGFGLLLAFTPCVFPMVPILSTLIAGQGASLTRRRAILLSLTYILTMAVTYTVAGVLAALLGHNLQAWFQNPWVIGFFSGLFVLLALSMFGIYDLQLPANLQNRLVDWSNRQRGGHHAGVAVMGLLSALIVSPCVAPPLIGALTFIAVTGDVALGATALFALSLGMGAPLLAVGASAGHWLPHAGHWMGRVKTVFGVLLLGVALWLLERILPPALTMVLWATLLIVTANYMGAMQPQAHGAPAWRTLVKGLGLVLLIYGILLLVGVAAGGRDPWQPLRGIGLIAHAANQAPAPEFRRVKTVAEVDRAVRAAGGRPVMLDFYADWCASCKELERYTFTDPGVRAALAGMVILQADVTANDEIDQVLLKRFGIVGPPAILFFGPDGRERREYRLVGFLEAARFAQHLRSMLARKG
ncbi:MAG: protein-disulfide reductase DsbD, partial [Candidatus Competibacter sp.]|nr:protein-disulfide reductase DsbD [Candidatus Competibacter sp.]